MHTYKLDGPTCLSFSGGRTSAYMLHEVLRHNTADDLARWLVVCFANTGKEEEATLRFVRECGERWGAAIRWVEWEKDGYREVTFDTASRDGEPFEALIRHRAYLPNPVTRFCTSELKIRTMHRFLRANWQALGWDAEDLEWNQMIGIRADEARRVAKIRARGHSTETTKESMLMPLADAGVTVGDVQAFWAAQPFNLELPTYKGRTLAYAPAATLAPLQYLEIVAAAALGYVIFGDFPDPMTWAGIAVISASGLYIIHRERVLVRQGRHQAPADPPAPPADGPAAG